MKKALFISFIIFVFYFDSFSQEIKIEAVNRPLNEILIDVRNNSKLNISFNDSDLSLYKITLNKTFNSPESAFQHLLNDLPIAFKKSGNVYIFFPKPKLAKTYRLAGKIIDTEDMESLPFSHVVINESGEITDEFGNFNFKSETDSIFHIKVSYLGYQISDTIIKYGVNHIIRLKSTVVNLKEVIVKANNPISAGQTGDEAGLTRLNHKVALLIPGNGDNSVFNLLRLHPGIMAAGEQSSELIIWGSNAGQSQVNFDGMTIFGLKNFNDNISVINPYMAKDIRIYKGGFEASQGERIGGIVNITGIDGSKSKADANINLNNMTMNILAETPIGKNFSIVGAYRQTYYNLYSPNDIELSSSTQNHFTENGINVNPAYQFRDGNLKFSGITNNGNSYRFSTFWGQDEFSYNTEQIHQNTSISQDLNEKNKQFGLSTQYHKLWKGIGSSKLNIAYSGLQTQLLDIQNSSDAMMGHNMHNQNKHVKNNVSEFKTELSNIINIKKHKLEFGLGYIANSILLNEDSDDINIYKEIKDGTQVVGFIQDDLLLHPKIDVTLGIRSNYYSTLNKFYIQPRIRLAFTPFSNFKLNAAFGLYNQFISKTSVVDQYNNYSYIWDLSDNTQIPVLSSQHVVLGSSYKKNGFSINIEGYYKKSNGLTRILQDDVQNTIYSGKSKSKGIDFFLKQDYKGSSVWVSYTLSESLEWFPYFNTDEYQKAIHDQRHEIKFSGIINLFPFFISANYVYGSGFLQNINNSNDFDKYPYKRFDIAGIYKFVVKKIKLEAGVSFLNVFNYGNIKLSDITQIPTENGSTVSIYSEAVPFTPTIFLNLTF